VPFVLGNAQFFLMGFLIRGAIILRHINQVKDGDESGLVLLEVGAIVEGLIAVIRVEGEHEAALISGFPILTHDLPEAVGRDVLDPLLLIDLVHRDPFVL